MAPETPERLLLSPIQSVYDWLKAESVADEVLEDVLDDAETALLATTQALAHISGELAAMSRMTARYTDLPVVQTLSEWVEALRRDVDRF